MTWWAWLWMGALLVVTAGGAWDDLRDERPRWYVACGAVAGLVCVAAVAVFFSRVGLAGRYLVPALVFAAGWLVVETIGDLRHAAAHADGNEAPDRVATAIGVVVALALFVPALVLGALAAAR